MEIYSEFSENVDEERNKARQINKQKQKSAGSKL